MAGLGSLFIDMLVRTGKLETDLGRAAKIADRRAKEIQRSFQQAAAKINSELEKGFKQTPARLSQLVAGLGFGVSLSAVLEETAKAERAMAALNNAVKNNAGAAGFTAKELASLSSELQKVTIYADDSIQEMQALLLTFREIRGTQFERAQTAVLDLATALGQDLKSAAMLVGRALADPVGGMSKLARSGIILTSEQKKLVKQLAETGQMSEAQGVLLQQLEARFGGAAKAARDSFGGALEALKNAFGDLLEQKDSLPKLTKTVNEMIDTISSPETQKRIDQTGSLIVDLFGIITDLGRFVSAPNRAQGGWFIDFLQDAIEKTRELKRTLVDRSLSENIRLLVYGQTRNVEPAVPVSAPNGGAPNIPPPSEEFLRLSEKLEEQIALYGKVGKAAEISYQIQKGTLDEMSKSEQQQLLALARRYDAVVAAAEAEKKAKDRQKQAQEEWQQLLERGARITEEVQTPYETYKQKLQELNDALGLGVISLETYGRALEKLRDELVQTADAVSEFASQNSESLDQSLEAFEADFEARFLKGLETLTVFQEQAARNTQDIIADTLVSGFDEGVDGVLKSFGEMLKKLIAQAVAADIAKRLFGAAGGGTGGGWIGMAAGALGFGGGRAIGGPVLAGTTYRINEREPEFFRPRVGGDIIPLSKMPSMGGGTVVNNNFTVRTETGERVSRRTEQQIAAAASRGLAMASRRNN